MTTRWSRRRLLLAATGAVLWACGRDDGATRSDAATPGAHRIASQTVLSDEVLWDLGPTVRAQVVAVSRMADDLRYSRVVDRWPRAIPRASGHSEALLALVPSLVILASFTAPETRRLLQDAGLRLLLLERFDGFADYRANVRAIARAVDAPAEGERVVAEFDARLAALRHPDDDGPRVVSWNEGNVAAADTSFHDVATAAGFRNLPATLGHRGHLQVGVEQLVAWDPDVLVVPCSNDDDDGRACSSTAAEVAAMPGLRATKAARHQAIVPVPSRALYSSGAGMLDVVERLRRAHPDGPRENGDA